MENNDLIIKKIHRAMGTLLTNYMADETIDCEGSWTKRELEREISDTLTVELRSNFVGWQFNVYPSYVNRNIYDVSVLIDFGDHSPIYIEWNSVEFRPKPEDISDPEAEFFGETWKK